MAEQKFTAMISQPMAGRSETEITETREKAKAYLEGKGYVFVNTPFTDERYTLENMVDEGVVNIPLYYFANSVLNMSMCHAHIFAKAGRTQGDADWNMPWRKLTALKSSRRNETSLSRRCSKERGDYSPLSLQIISAFLCLSVRL